MTRLEQLRASIGILASKSEDQLAYLTGIGHIAIQNNSEDLLNIDEIALQFEDADYATEGLARDALLSQEAVIAIDNLKSELRNRSEANDTEFWTVGALKNDIRWSKIRTLALQALVLMGGA